MKITTIKYERLIPTGSYSNEKIGFECSIDQRENPLEVIEQLRVMAEESHKQKYFHLYDNSYIGNSPSSFQYDAEKGVLTASTLEEIQVVATKTPTEKIIDQINQCSDIKVLESFKLLAKNNAEIQTAYDNRLKQLTK